MSTAAGGAGLTHEAALYRTDDELVDIAAPYLQDGLAARETCLVAVSTAVAALLRRALPGAPLVFFPAPQSDGNPTAVLARFREALAAQRDAGVARVRMLGEVPHPGAPVSTDVAASHGRAASPGPAASPDATAHGARSDRLVAPHRRATAWDWWARFEAAVVHSLGDFDAWALCPYDLRTTPPDVVGDVVATHPYLTDGRGRHRANPDVLPVREFLARPRPAARHPLEYGPPHTELQDPTPAAARTAARYLTAHLPPRRVEEFVFGLSEAVSNASLHGVPPVRVRLWSGHEHAVAAVTDLGPGPGDPFAGLLPDRTALSGGLGLWAMLQVCPYVAFEHLSGGFTLRVGTG